MVYQLKDTLTEEMNMQGEGVISFGTFAQSHYACLNQRIHAANFGLGRQRVLQTGCLSALHYI